jgi:transposase-like protein
MNEALREPCQIERVGGQRSGGHRYWCQTHGANATGRLGVRLEQCESAYRDIDPGAIRELDIQSYPGGVAIWGAVAPIFDTTNISEVLGVHVHARHIAEGKKDIDGTFPAIAMKYKKDLFNDGRAIITQETAVSFYLSRFLGLDVVCLFCTYCTEPHLDAGWFAVKPHKKHLCHACGRYFSADHRGVSNPIAKLREEVDPVVIDQSPVPATRACSLLQTDYPEGIQVWASNPAVFWIGVKPEESGIHVHAYDSEGRRVVDDTFGEVSIDGRDLPREQVAYLMAQSTMPHLNGRIESLTCECGTEAFDSGLDAFSPRIARTCLSCGATVKARGKTKKVVSNPLARILRELKEEGLDRHEGLYLHNGKRHRSGSSQQP